MASYHPLNPPQLLGGILLAYDMPCLRTLNTLIHAGRVRDAQEHALILANNSGGDCLVEAYASLFVAASAEDNHVLGYRYATKGFDAAKRMGSRQVWKDVFLPNQDILMNHISIHANDSLDLAHPRRHAPAPLASRTNLRLKPEFSNTAAGNIVARRKKRAQLKRKLRAKEGDLTQRMAGLGLGGRNQREGKENASNEPSGDEEGDSDMVISGGGGSGWLEDGP